MISNNTITETISDLHKRMQSGGGADLRSILVDVDKFNDHPFTDVYKYIMSRTSDTGFHITDQTINYPDQNVLLFDEGHHSALRPYFKDLPKYFAEIHAKEGHSYMQHSRKFSDHPDIGILVTEYLIRSNFIYSLTWNAGSRSDEDYWNPEFCVGPHEEYLDYPYEFEFKATTSQYTPVQDVEDPDAPDTWEWVSSEVKFLSGFYNCEDTPRPTEGGIDSLIEWTNRKIKVDDIAITHRPDHTFSDEYSLIQQCKTELAAA